jgi:DNA-binding NtrC family response regulator
MAYESASRVLAVDRDPAVRRSISDYLGSRGFEVVCVDDLEKAFNLLDDRLFDVIVAELGIQRGAGMRLLHIGRERNPDVCVIFAAEARDQELALESMRQGAYDFQIKPLMLEKLEAVIRRALEHQRLVLQQVELRRLLDERYGLRNIIGRSRQMVHIYNALRQVAPTSGNVLLVGEAGTGKDLVAHAIHTNSPRRDSPFVSLNCDGLPPEALDRELHGRVTGALGGGEESRAGRFELAEGGTLYLDRVDALTPPVQERLHDILHTHRLTRIGGSHPVRINARIISASPVPLAPLVNDGCFSEDLYRLLAPVVIELPPLRVRREDIPLLASHFLRESAHAHGKTIERITRNALDLLSRYDWPGNARQLRNVVDSMVIAGRSGRDLDVGDLPQHVRDDAAAQPLEIRLPTGATMAEIERVAIEETLKACDYNKEKAAKMLDIGLRTLYRKLKEYERQ